MDFQMLESLISGAGGAGTAVLIIGFLLRKIFLDLSRQIDRTDAILRENKLLCDRRMESNTLEYKQIMASLNEIKVQIARNEAIYSLRNNIWEHILKNCPQKPGMK